MYACSVAGGKGVGVGGLGLEGDLFVGKVRSVREFGVVGEG